MYKILCLASGTEIKWPYSCSSYHLKRVYTYTKLIPRDIQQDMYIDNITRVISFATKESATWFVQRSLSYNDKRTDKLKLGFMSDVLIASEIDITITKEYMFETVEA